MKDGTPRSKNIEEESLAVGELTYNPQGLIPAIVQEQNDDGTPGAVLMLAWMNEESLTKTLKTRKTWFYSRSRQKLWMKGEESGNTQDVIDVQFDCDADTLLVSVHPNGPACHTGENTCFYRSL